VSASQPKHQGATTTASSARYAANRIAKSLVANARSASRQGSVAVAPAKKPRLPTHPSGPAARPQLHADPTPSNGKSSVAAALPAASPAAAAAALEQAAASGKVGCPKCRYAKYGCKKCRNAYVKKTGVLIPVDRSVQAAAFALLQPASGSSQGPKSGQPATKVSQPPSASAAASQVTGTGIDRSGKVQSAAQLKSAKRQSSVSEIDQQQAAKKQKRAPDKPMAKQAASSKQASGGTAPVTQDAKSGKPATAVLPASSSAPGSRLTGSVKKSCTAAQPDASEVSARLAKRVRPASSPAPPHGSTDPGDPAAKRSRLSESVAAADAAADATAPNAVQAKPSRASQPNAAANRSDKDKAKAAGVKNSSATALHRLKPSSVSKPSFVSKLSSVSKPSAAAAATEAQKHRGSSSGAPQPSRSSGAVRRPVRLAPAGPNPGSSKQQDVVKGSTAAVPSAGQLGKGPQSHSS